MKKLQILGVYALAGLLMACNNNTASRQVWHASWRESLIRAYNENLWGTGNSANATTTLNLAACGNAKPNDVLQDGGGNIIFTDSANGKVIRINAGIFSSGGTIKLTAAQCTTIASGLTEVIGLALDIDQRSIFYGSNAGVGYLQASGTSYTPMSIGNLAAAGTVSGIKAIANRLYVVDYSNFNNASANVKVYDLNVNRTTATLKLTFTPTSSTFALPEGIAYTNGRIWVSNNNAANIMGFRESDINSKISSNPGSAQTIAFQSLEHETPGTDAYLQCPGGLATDADGNLWVNVQGASAANADCGSTATAFGSVFMYAASQLNFSATSTTKPKVQLSGIASVPGYGGIAFSK